MFIHQFVYDIIQNHKDAPNNWKLSIPHKRAVNDTHKITIELSYYGSKLYDCFIEDTSISNTLNFFDRRALVKYFRPLLMAAFDIPTKEKSPEKFI